MTDRASVLPRDQPKVPEGIGRKRTQMNDDLFNELQASVREAGAIMRGEAEASRVTVVDEPDAGATRE